MDVAQNCCLDMWDGFESEFLKVKLGQHIGGRLKRVLGKTHLAREVLKIIWQ